MDSRPRDDADPVEQVAALAGALHAAAGDDPAAAALALALEAAPTLRSAAPIDARARLGAARAALGLPSSVLGPPSSVLGPPSSVLGPPSSDSASALRAGLSALAADGPALGLPPSVVADLSALAAAPVPPAAAGARSFVAAVRALDDARRAARAPDRAALAARVAPLLAEAVAAARARGARVLPDDAPPPPALAPRHAPAFGTPPGAVLGVERHGFVLPDGRAEAPVLRVAVGPAPAWLPDLEAAHAALVEAAPRVEGGPALAAAVRAWLDALPGAPDEERRLTTLRYAATATFALVAVDPRGPDLFARLVRALEDRGQALVPLDPAALADARRYEVLARPGAGPPRVVRPGFVGRDGVVVQRARVSVDAAALPGA